MAFSVGQVLRGQRGIYCLKEALKPNTVFKAQVLQSSAITAQLAVVKTEPDPEKFLALRRELRNYQLPGFSSCEFIRALYDTIVTDSEVSGRNERSEKKEGCPSLVLEWMAHDLRNVSSHNFRQGSNLPKIIAKSVLSALDFIKSEYDGVHTDINPNNVLLSNIEDSSPVVKIADLGNMLRQGYDTIRLQSLATRAPEVWRGLGCWHVSDVWSLGVTLAHWLSPVTIFGKRDKIVEGLTEAWCIAKIERLVGKLDPPINNPDFEEEFAVAHHLESCTFIHPDTGQETRYIEVGTIRQELEKLPGPKIAPDLLDFIDHLLVVDHTKRPTAKEALGHPYLQSPS